MTRTGLHRATAPIKRFLPRSLWGGLRRVGTACITPFRFSWRSGHLRSSLGCKPVDRQGQPLPWYSYPAIDFLLQREHHGVRVLEFGAGYSTLWWAAQGARVTAFEGDAAWMQRLSTMLPDGEGAPCVYLVTLETAQACADEIAGHLATEADASFDVVVIDGLHREAMVPLARRYVARDGVIVVDNADGYGMQAAFSDSGRMRVDFFGHAPGVVLPHATSMWFTEESAWFQPGLPIPKIAETR